MDSEFTVVFPSRETLRMSTRSGKLYPPLCKTEADIREAFVAAKPSLVLPAGWVKLTGVPEDLAERERMMVAFTMIRRPIDVDELSVQKRDREVIRMRFQCRHPERVKGTVQMFFNGEGYTVGVQAEAHGRGGGFRGPPLPPANDDIYDEDSDDLSDEEWNRDTFNLHHYSIS
jgi:hypothetical protein